MLAIIGFLIFVGGSALAYRAESYARYQKWIEIVAGILLVGGLSLLGANLAVSLCPVAR